MSDEIVFVLLAPLAFLAGVYGERLRAKAAWRTWRRKRGKTERVAPFPRAPKAPMTDSADQLRVVMGAPFTKRRLLSKSEARVLYAAESAIKSLELTWRVMAQVSLGEVLSSPDAQAYGAINSKRVDLLLITRGGEPVAAIEYQGSGHYQGSAAGRDAVKKEALRRAGVRYIEVTPEHGQDHVAREISRIARAAKAEAAGYSA